MEQIARTLFAGTTCMFSRKRKVDISNETFKRKKSGLDTSKCSFPASYQ